MGGERRTLPKTTHMEINITELATLLGAKTQPNAATVFWQIGKKYFIRTVTHHHTGQLVAIGDKEIVLEKAAWIADDGRLQQALEKAEFSEVEMFPAGLVLIGRGSIIDAVAITTLPESQK